MSLQCNRSITALAASVGAVGGSATVQCTRHSAIRVQRCGQHEVSWLLLHWAGCGGRYCTALHRTASGVCLSAAAAHRPLPAASGSDATAAAAASSPKRPPSISHVALTHTQTHTRIVTTKRDTFRKRVRKEKKRKRKEKKPPALPGSAHSGSHSSLGLHTRNRSL